MKCSYCEVDNEEAAVKCNFCNAPFNKIRPKLKEFVYIEQTSLPFEELESFHTYDLLVLLRLVRKERTISYNLMRSVQKGAKHVEVDSETLSIAEKDYRQYTARMKLIEGILIDRMGYKPKRVDDKLLISLKNKISHEV